MDIIRLSDGHVIRTISQFLHKEEFTNPLVCMTSHWISLKFGPKNPMFHIYEDRKIDLNRSHVLSQDEIHFVLDQCHQLVIREFGNWDQDEKKTCGIFDHDGM